MVSLAHYPGGPAPSRPELIANDEKGAILPSRSSTWVRADLREAVDALLIQLRLLRGAG